jgi:hypothetical protein
MHNHAGKKTLDYTSLLDDYRGYIIAWAVNPSMSEPGRWMGHYHARKDGAATLAASIANLQDSPEAAEANTIRLAKAAVDNALDSQN